MRPLLIVLAGLCASVSTSLVVYAAIQLEKKPFVEVLQGALLRTNAEEMTLNNALTEVMKINRLPGKSLEERLEASDYHEHGDVWFSRPDLFGHAQERASRMVRQQLDRSGRPIRLEVLRGDDMPTLVFVHHEDRDAANRVARQLAAELTESGVRQLN